MDDLPEFISFRDYVIFRGIEHHEEDGAIFTKEEDMLKYRDELTELFPQYFIPDYMEEPNGISKDN